MTETFRIVTGNILRSAAEALVNPVNTVGVSGRGLAAKFAAEFPESTYGYVAQCRASRLKLGTVWAPRERESGKLIVYFPTKRHWRERSDLGNIVDGLEALRGLVQRRHIKSIAVPALGCGLGGLSWRKVCPEIEKALSSLDGCRVEVYAPVQLSES